MRVFNKIGPERLQGVATVRGYKGRIYVGPGSKFQNTHQKGDNATSAELARYIEELTRYPAPKFWQRLDEFRGRDLVCTCKDDRHCHAAWLLAQVNASEPFLD